MRENLEVKSEICLYLFISIILPFSGKWYGGEGPPKQPGREIYAFPGTANSYQLTSATLVPGANLIFRIRSASDHAIGRASRRTLEDTCITPQRGKLIY